MTSLSRRLLTYTTLAVTCTLGLSGWVLYRQVERSLVAELDDALRAKARLLSSAVEVDEGELELEFESMDLWEFESPERGWFLELWSGDETLYRSSSLDGSALRDDPLLASVGPAPTWLRLPGARRGRVLLMTFTPKLESRRARQAPAPVTLAIARDTRELDRTLVALEGGLLGVGLAALLLTGAVLTLVVRRSLAPLEAVCARIGSIDAGALSARLDPAGVPRELLPVVERVNELLGRLEVAFGRERAFTDDVAHELRTPLAGLRALLEVTGSRPRSEAEHAAALREGLAIVEQLQALVERLLQLARLEAGLAPLTPERVDLSELLVEAWAPHAAAAAARGLRVELRMGDAAPLTTDRRLLHLIARNLLENAVTYADAGGRVRVEARSGADGVTLEVANTGSALGPEEVALATQRFWRGSAARTEAGVHCGLGLSLVERATRALGGRLELRSEGGELLARVAFSL